MSEMRKGERELKKEIERENERERTDQSLRLIFEFSERIQKVHNCLDLCACVFLCVYVCVCGCLLNFCVCLCLDTIVILCCLFYAFNELSVKVYFDIFLFLFCSIYF